MPLFLNRALGSVCNSGVFQLNAVWDLDSLADRVVSSDVVAASNLEFDIIIARDQVIGQLMFKDDGIHGIVAIEQINIEFQKRFQT